MAAGTNDFSKVNISTLLKLSFSQILEGGRPREELPAKSFLWRNTQMSQSPVKGFAKNKGPGSHVKMICEVAWCLTFKKKIPFLCPISKKKSSAGNLNCYLRLKAGLGCIFEVSIQSGVYYSQDLNYKNRVGNENTENFRIRARSLSWLLQHLSFVSSYCQMEQ